MNVVVLAVGVAALVGPSAAFAGGMSIPGAGPQAQARAGAFAAKADDPTAMAHNPAGFAKHSGTTVLLGGNFVDYDMRFARAGRYEASLGDNQRDYEGLDYPVVEDQSRAKLGIGEFALIPTVIVVTDFGRPELPFRVAFGLFTPQGYSPRKFAETVDVGTIDRAPSPQRYDIIEQDAAAALPSIAIGYSVSDKLDVGLRASWGFASIKGRKSVWSFRNYEEDPTQESIFTIDAKDNFIPAFGLGALYRPTSYLEFGFNYLSQAAIKSKGTGNSVVNSGNLSDVTTVPVDDRFVGCNTGGVEGALKACLDLIIPRMATIAGRYIWRDTRGDEKADVELDVRWEQWSASANTRIIVDGQVSVGGDAFFPLNPAPNRHGFRDVFSFRLGGHYSIPVGKNKLILRGGAAYDTAAAPDSWTRADLDGKARTTLATGIAFELSRFRIDLGVGVVLERDITVAQCAPPDGPNFANQGCDGQGDEKVVDRVSPDPTQPLQGPLNQIQSPFNAGKYESGYRLVSIGLTTWF